MRAYTDFHSYTFYSKHVNIFLRDYLFITTIIIFVVFLAWLLNRKTGCDDLPVCVTPPQASMKLSPPNRSPALPRRGPPHRYCCSPPCHRHSPVRAAGTTGTAGTGDSPAQGG